MRKIKKMAMTKTQTAVRHRRGEDVAGKRDRNAGGRHFSEPMGVGGQVPVLAATLDGHEDVFMFVVDVTANVCELTFRDDWKERRTGDGRWNRLRVRDVFLVKYPNRCVVSFHIFAHCLVCCRLQVGYCTNELRLCLALALSDLSCAEKARMSNRRSAERPWTGGTCIPGMTFCAIVRRPLRSSVARR